MNGFETCLVTENGKHVEENKLCGAALRDTREEHDYNLGNKHMHGQHAL